MSNDIIGTRIGIYDVISECETRANDGHKLYHVKCSVCGWEADMIKSHINQAKVCKHMGINGKYLANTKWGNRRIQSIFHGMKDRCYNPNNKSYRWYGERGIKIYNEWLDDPKTFEDWALTNGYTDDLTIDRIDESKDYSPDNCQWVTMEDNSKYKSTTSLIEVNGIVKTGQDWAKSLGLGQNIINTYIKKYGLENTQKFIELYQQNPNRKPKNKNQSYYTLYVNEKS